MMDVATSQSFRLLVLLADCISLVIWTFQASFGIKQNATVAFFTLIFLNSSDFKGY